jgi:hypothetical protein
VKKKQITICFHVDDCKVSVRCHQMAAQRLQKHIQGR